MQYNGVVQENVKEKIEKRAKAEVSFQRFEEKNRLGED